MKSAAIRAVFHLRKTKESSVAWKCDRKIELRYKTVIPYRCRSLASFGGRGGDNLAAKASRRRRRIRTKELEQGYTDPPTRKRCSRTTERRYRDDSGRYPAGSSREGYPVTSSYRSRNRSMLLYVVFSFHDRAFSRGLWGKARRSRAAAPLSRSGSEPRTPAFSTSDPGAICSTVVFRNSQRPIFHGTSRNPLPSLLYAISAFGNRQRRIAFSRFHVHPRLSSLRPRLGVRTGQSRWPTAEPSNRAHWSERIIGNGNRKQTARNPPFVEIP